MTPQRTITIDGETKTLREWSAISGIPHERIRIRLSRGFSPYAAVFGPLYAKAASTPTPKPKRARVEFPVGLLPRWGSVESVNFRRAA